MSYQQFLIIGLMMVGGISVVHSAQCTLCMVKIVLINIRRESLAVLLFKFLGKI